MINSAGMELSLSANATIQGWDTRNVLAAPEISPADTVSWDWNISKPKRHFTRQRFVFFIYRINVICIHDRKLSEEEDLISDSARNEYYYV